MYKVFKIHSDNTTAKYLEDFLNYAQTKQGLRLIAVDSNGYYIFEEPSNIASRPTALAAVQDEG